jgi:DNA-binding transcriptional LysR family regulator
VSLLAGDIDLLLTYRPVTKVPIESVYVAEEELVLVGATAGVPLPIDQLEACRWVTYEEYDYVFARWFAGVHGRQPRSLLRHDHFDELEEALSSVKLGRGMTIAPTDACKPPV